MNDIYQTTRVNQPSIVGNTTFPQYFSIRKNKRDKGTINISDHFEKWESLGMEMGKLHEVAFVVEGYQSDGSFEFKAIDISVNNETVQVEENVTLPESLKNFPNPSCGNVSIQLNKAVSGANVNIYDNSGRVIFSEDNINKDLIHVTNLESGIYFVSVNSNSLTYNSKLLVY